MSDHGRDPNGPSLAEENRLMRTVLYSGAFLGFLVGFIQAVEFYVIGIVVLMLLTKDTYRMITQCYPGWPFWFKLSMGISYVIIVMYLGIGFGVIARYLVE